MRRFQTTSFTWRPTARRSNQVKPLRPLTLLVGLKKKIVSQRSSKNSLSTRAWPLRRKEPSLAIVSAWWKAQLKRDVWWTPNDALDCWKWTQQSGCDLFAWGKVGMTGNERWQILLIGLMAHLEKKKRIQWCLDLLVPQLNNFNKYKTCHLVVFFFFFCYKRKIGNSELHQK